ncbi:MAG: hypothetical protein U9Q88_02635, partial [Bacillota bacterium]|nr:hypothetical protein [Bacillota bacterium]
LAGTMTTFQVGKYSPQMTGQLDEIRVSNVSRSDAWIIASYNTLWNATDGGFYSLGAQESEGGSTMSISVNVSSWDPSCKIGENESTESDWAMVTNDGDVSFDVDIKATNTTNWTVGATPSHNDFNMSFKLDGGTWTTMSYDDVDFVNDLASSATQKFGLRIYMPTTTSTNDQQNTTITFTITSS